MGADILLHAPGVHTGGGLALLQELLAVIGDQLIWASLDSRAPDELTCPLEAPIFRVAPRLASRWEAERALRRAARKGATILCFHGLPPLLRSEARVKVFVQNKLHLERGGNKAPWRVRARISIERQLCSSLRHHVDEYIVQTPSMARALRQWHGGAPTIRIAPFLEATRAATEIGGATVCDFIYLADGAAHKNQQRLFEAWEILAQAGLRPLLTVTLGDRDGGVIDHMYAVISRSGARIVNLGTIPRESALQQLGMSRALIFPSTTESFGIPLLEAARMGIPILASERDYVRDIVVPVETFDPHSPTSIARAVRRFLGEAEPVTPVGNASDFIDAVQS